MDTSIPLNFSMVSALCSEKSRKLFSRLKTGYGSVERFRLKNTDNEVSVSTQLLRLLYSKNGINLSHALNLFHSINSSEFELIVKKIIETKNNEKAVYSLTYYILLFRQDPQIRQLIENSALPLEFVEAVINAVLLRKNLNNGGENNVLTELLGIFPKQALFDLAVKTKGISKNKTLILHLLSKMDSKNLNLYFEDTDNVNNFIDTVSQLPVNFTEPFFFHNPKLHGYYVFLLNTIDIDELSNGNEIRKIDLSEADITKKMSADVTSNTNLSHEKSMQLLKRKKSRFAYIVNRLRHLKDKSNVLISLENEGTINSEEIILIKEILSNPLLGDALAEYCEESQQYKSTQPVSFF